ncbi:MAG: S-layer homology domain-containing protein [Oscillospiraceae bacterium]|nr:S-layer homology domain-containing protein [Oscillospiraceae bacterium]
MKTKLFAKTIAILLIVVMAATMLPLGVFAAGIEQQQFDLHQQAAEVRGGMFTAYDGTEYAVLYNDYIAVYVNRSDGGFAILPATETFDFGKPLSHATFQIDGETYNYGRYYEGISGIFGIAPMVNENNILDSHWQIGDFVISQIFAITSDALHENSYAVKAGYAAQYFGEGSANIAGRILLDTQFTEDENVPIMLIDSADNIALVDSEAILRPAPKTALISKAHIEEANNDAGETVYIDSPNKGYIMFDDNSFASPAAVVFAEFGGASSADFDYTPTGAKLFGGTGADSAALLYWDSVSVASGYQATFGTNIGFYDLERGYPHFDPFPSEMDTSRSLGLSALSGEIDVAEVRVEYFYVPEDWFTIKCNISLAKGDDPNGNPKLLGLLADIGDEDAEFLIVVDYNENIPEIIKNAIINYSVQIRWSDDESGNEGSWLLDKDDAEVGEDITVNISNMFRSRPADSFLEVSLVIDADYPIDGYTSIRLNMNSLDAEFFSAELSGDYVVFYDFPNFFLGGLTNYKRYLVKQGAEFTLTCEMQDMGNSLSLPSTYNYSNGVASIPFTTISEGPLTYIYTFNPLSTMKRGSIDVRIDDGSTGDRPQPVNVKAFNAMGNYDPDIETALWNAVDGESITREMGIIWAVPGTTPDKTVYIDSTFSTAYPSGNLYVYKAGTKVAATGVTNPITAAGNFFMPDEPVDLVYEDSSVYRVFTEVTGGSATVTVNSINGSTPQAGDQVFIFVTNIEDGYEIDSVSGVGETPVEVPGGAWSFIMPSGSDVTVTVTLDTIPAPKPFYNINVKPLVGDGMVLYDLMLWTDAATGDRAVYQVDEAGRTGQVREGETVYYVLYPTTWNTDAQYVPDMARWVVDGFTMNGTTVTGFAVIDDVINDFPGNAPAYFPATYDSSNANATAGTFTMPDNNVEFEITGYKKDHNYSLSIEAYNQYGQMDPANLYIRSAPATNGIRETWFEYPANSASYTSWVWGIGQFPITQQTALQVQNSIYNDVLQSAELVVNGIATPPLKTEVDGNFTTYYWSPTWPYSGTVKLYYESIRRTLTINGYPRGDGYLEPGHVLVLPGDAWNAPGEDARSIAVMPVSGNYETFITLRWSMLTKGRPVGTYYYLNNANSTNCTVIETHRDADSGYAVYKVTMGAGMGNASVDIQARDIARDIGFSNYFMPNSPNSATFQTVTLAAEHVILEGVVTSSENMKNIMTATPAPKITRIGLIGEGVYSAIVTDADIFISQSSAFSWEDSTGERIVIDIRELFGEADDYIFPDGKYRLTIEYAYGDVYSQSGSKEYSFDLGYDKFKPGELTHVAVVKFNTGALASLPEGTPAGIGYGSWIAVPARNYDDMVEQAKKFNTGGHFIYFVCETGFKTNAPYPYAPMSGTHQYLADGGATVSMSGGGSFTPNSSMGGFALDVEAGGLTIKTKEMKFNSSWMPLFTPIGSGGTRTDMLTMELEHNKNYTIPESLPDYDEIRKKHATNEEAVEEWMEEVEEAKKTMLAMKIEYPTTVFSASAPDDFLSAELDGKGLAVSIGGFDGGITFDVKEIYLMKYGYETGGRLNIQIPGMTIPILRLEVISMTTDSWSQYIPIADVWAEGEGRLQLPAALGGYGASAYGVFNTYLDNYGFDGEVNFHFIELSGSFYIAKTVYGFPMLDTFIVSVGLNDVPVGLGLPPAPAQIIEISGITVGVTNLADTVSYNPLKNTIPSVRIILGAKFSFVEILDFNAEMWAELLSVGFSISGGVSVGPINIDLFKEVSVGAGAKDGPYMPYEYDPDYAVQIKGKRSITFYINTKIHADIFLVDASLIFGINATISPALWEKRGGFTSLKELNEFISLGLSAWGAGSVNVLPMSEEWSIGGAEIGFEIEFGPGKNIEVMPINFTKFIIEAKVKLLGVTVEDEKVSLLAYYRWLEDWLREKVEEKLRIKRIQGASAVGAMGIMGAIGGDFALMEPASTPLALMENAQMQLALMSQALASPELLGTYGDIGSFTEHRSYLGNVEATSETRSAPPAMRPGLRSIASGSGTISAEFDGSDYTHLVSVPNNGSDYILKLTGYGGATPDFTDIRVFKPNGQALTVRGASGDMTAAQAEFGYNAVILNGALLLSLADYLDDAGGGANPTVTGVGSTLPGVWQVISGKPFKSELIKIFYPKVASVELSAAGVVTAKFENIDDATDGEYYYDLTLERKGYPTAEPLEAMILLKNEPVPLGGNLSLNLIALPNPADSNTPYNVRDILTSGDWYARVTLRQGKNTMYTMDADGNILTSGSGESILETSKVDDKISQTAYKVNNALLSGATWTHGLTAAPGGNQSIDVSFAPASPPNDTMSVVGYHVTVYDATTDYLASRIVTETDALGNTIQKVVPLDFDVMTDELSTGQMSYGYNIQGVPVGKYIVGVSPLYADLVPILDEDGNVVIGEYKPSAGVTRKGTEVLSGDVTIAQAAPPSLSMSISGGSLTYLNGQKVAFAGTDATLSAKTDAGATVEFYEYDGKLLAGSSGGTLSDLVDYNGQVLMIVATNAVKDVTIEYITVYAATSAPLLLPDNYDTASGEFIFTAYKDTGNYSITGQTAPGAAVGGAVAGKDGRFSLTGTLGTLAGGVNDGTVTLAVSNPAGIITIREVNIVRGDENEPVPPSGGGGYQVTTPPTDTGTEADIENPFKDVKGNDWFYDAVMYAYSHGLMNGVAPEIFSPNTPITRAMAVTILFRLAEKYGMENGEWKTENEDKGTNNSQFSTLNFQFTDIEDTAWYRDAVLWAASVGIVNGYGNGKFGPNDNITRQDLAVILARYADLFGITFANSQLSSPPSQLFTDDADIANYAKEAIERFFKAGIIGGYPDGSVKPKGEATRAEFATMMMRFLEVIK